MRCLSWLASIVCVCALLAGCGEGERTKGIGLAKDLPGMTGGEKADEPADKAAEEPAEEKAGVADMAKDAATKRAQELVDEATAAIKADKLGKAEDIISKLESMKGEVPASMQEKIASLRTSLDAAKALKGTD